MQTAYKAETCHTEETIRILSRVQYLSFRKGYIILQFVLGVAFASAGLFVVQDKTASILCCLFGCWMLVSWNQIPLFRANKIIRECGGQFFKTSYSFDDNGIAIHNEQLDSTLDYRRIIRLVQDESYFYLFISNEGAYMIPRSAITPNEPLQFAQMLESKTGLSFIENRSVFLLSRKSLLAERRNTKL